MGSPGFEQRQPSPPTSFVPDRNGDSQVARFYQDRAVFLTGGTGFIGKVLLEKLLRSCPGLKQVYLLIRTKRGEEPQARLATMLSSKVFESLKQDRPRALDKVRAVSGDITLPSLGLSASDRATLVEEVSVVFHSAATINFNEPLKLAVQLNVVGTQRVLDLCKEIPNLCAFVHVSTAYSNCEKRTEVEEEIYEPSVDIGKIIAASRCTEDKSMENADEFLFGMPNTYTLTKRLAELLLRDESRSIPVAIVRPSIVTASWKEPFPGWIENYAGCTGVIAGVGTGLLPSMLVKKDCIADIIPVDTVANTLICVAWHTAMTRSEHVRVYHCASGAFKCQTWGDMTTAVQEAVLRYPMPYVARYPKLAVTRSDLWYSANLWCLHCLPAFFGDLALQLMGQQPRFIQRYRKVRKRMDIVRYFTTHGWLFRSNNLAGLVGDLSPIDKELFSLDIENIEWRPYWDQYVLGIRKHLFKAEDDKLPDARRQLKWLYAVHLTLHLPLLILGSRLLMTEAASKLGYSTMTAVTKLWKTFLAMWHLSPAMTSLGFQQRQQTLSTAAGTKGDVGSQVARFYQDRVVFITGGTGFIGKVLLEKLLRSCPGLKRVYLLIRTKRGQEPQERLATILSSQAFERVKQEQPGAIDKVRAVSGDITLPNLGLSASDHETIVKEVSVVFHSAANIKLNDPLRLAVNINLFGTQRVLELCKKIANLSALVHVSTTYCNCDNGTEIDEVIYQPRFTAEKVIEAVERTDDNSMGAADGLLFGMPNTYTLTKRLAESLLRDERGSIPVAIVRPSIVTASWREPLPGWTDKSAAGTEMILSLGLGLLPSMLAKKECIADFVPVDITANMLICVAWHIANTRPENVRVYHCASGSVHRQTWADWTSAIQRAILHYPLPGAVRYPKFVVTGNRLWHSANLWCLNHLPACVGDLVLKVVGHEPRFVQRYQKVSKRIDLVSYFTTHGWLFRSNNVVGLIGDLSSADKKLFSIDVQNIELGPYWEQNVRGIRKYLFKAEDDELLDARRQMKRLYAVHLSLKFLPLILVSPLLMTETAWELGYSGKTVLIGLYEALLAL
ncbi:uncharacterized protein LOC144129978 [Amblyomma americanum]